MQTFRACVHLGRVVFRLGGAALAFLGTACRSRTGLAAENPFLRKRLARYRERQVKPRRAPDPMRLALAFLARCLDWRATLKVVQPALVVSSRTCLELAMPSMGRKERSTKLSNISIGL